jgi:hypothetical protein
MVLSRIDILQTAGNLERPAYMRCLKQRTAAWRAILVGKLVRVISSDNSHTIVIRITDVEFVRFGALSDEDVEAEGINFDITSAEKRVILRRILHHCYKGKNDFEDSEVLFRIRFQKIWKYKSS